MSPPGCFEEYSGLRLTKCFGEHSKRAAQVEVCCKLLNQSARTQVRDNTAHTTTEHLPRVSESVSKHQLIQVRRCPSCGEATQTASGCVSQRRPGTRPLSCLHSSTGLRVEQLTRTSQPSPTSSRVRRSAPSLRCDFKSRLGPVLQSGTGTSRGRCRVAVTERRPQQWKVRPDFRTAGDGLYLGEP